MLVIAGGDNFLEGLQPPCPRANVDTWMQTDPKTKLATELTGEPRSPRQTIKELRKLMQTNPGLSIVLGKATYQVLPSFIQAQGRTPSASVSTTTLTQFMCMGLRHRAFLAEKSGFGDEVCKLLEQIVQAGLTRTALERTNFFDDAARSEVLEAQKVWSSFRVFCGALLDFRGY
jgi:hypothetical protein